MLKIGLGTVQFGTDYGISNTGGRTPQDQVAAILSLGARRHVRVLDTAPAYGASEEVLGHALRGAPGFRIVTKSPAVRADRITDSDVDELEQTYLLSLTRLGQASIYGLLAHNGWDVIKPGGKRMLARMRELQARGLVQKIGVSVYSADELDAILERHLVDLVQLPYNVLDQRMRTGGQLARLKAAGVEVHARSVFLQGLLLMPPERLPAYFDNVRPHLERLREYIGTLGVTPLAGVLGFVTACPEVDVAVCGVNTCNQLVELLASQSPLPHPECLYEFGLDDPQVLNPTRWKG